MEPHRFSTVAYLFAQGKGNKRVLYSFGNSCTQRSRTDQFGEDIESLLREEAKRHCHNQNKGNGLTFDELKAQVKEMPECFDDETEGGKLNVNYSMVESIRYTKQLPDYAFCSYCIPTDLPLFAIRTNHGRVFFLPES
jgi:hypothetical protein